MDPQSPVDITKQRVANRLEVMQPGEQLIADIKRHPIGIIFVYITSGLLLIAIATLIFGALPQLMTSADPNQITQIGAVVLLIMTTLIGVYSLIATKVYWGNSWHVTSDSLTQVNQTSLFARQSSQLSLANLEDVSSEQNGILPHLFNYGQLKVETAGEQSKFIFIFCPNPNYYAQQILAAREAFEQGTHNTHIPPAQPPAGYPPVNH